MHEEGRGNTVVGGDCAATHTVFLLCVSVFFTAASVYQVDVLHCHQKTSALTRTEHARYSSGNSLRATPPTTPIKERISRATNVNDVVPKEVSTVRS